jgi:lipoyl(octanoyl) transferase
MNSAPAPLIRHLGLADYVSTWRAMEQFTLARTPETPDQIWFLQHPPVFTLGLAGKLEHLLDPGEIPVVHIDRGGQVTYHGPGQLVVYPLIDMHRARLGVRDLVSMLERCVIDCVARFGITARCRANAPAFGRCTLPRSSPPPIDHHD